ncbi:MAG TPA: hypothetical protein VLN49_06455 [Gemmatimonadaceae bacterium]|nr:hypothetical protein [Gemmatimonadaceae bacterium]
MGKDFLDEILKREGVPRSAHLRVNVVARRVRVNPDGTRSVVSETHYPQETLARKRSRSWWIALAFALFGTGQLGYGAWAGESDVAAAAVFRADQSCSSRWIEPREPAVVAPRGACRVDTATVVARHTRSSQRSGLDYWLVTVTPDGSRDDSPLLHRDAKLWDRVKPTQRITAQRFVAPGFHLTGSITAFADDTSMAFTWYHPDAGTHLQFANMLIGGGIAVVGVLIMLRQRSRPHAPRLLRD